MKCSAWFFNINLFPANERDHQLHLIMLLSLLGKEITMPPCRACLCQFICAAPCALQSNDRKNVNKLLSLLPVQIMLSPSNSLPLSPPGPALLVLLPACIVKVVIAARRSLVVVPLHGRVATHLNEILDAGSFQLHAGRC